MFHWLKNFNKRRFLEPAHSLEPYLSECVEKFRAAHIDLHNKYFKEKRKKNQNDDVLEYLDSHLDYLKECHSSAILDHTKRRIKAYRKQIEIVKEEIIHSDNVLIIIQEIKKKKEKDGLKVILNNLAFVNETKMFVISQDFGYDRQFSGFNSLDGHPFILCIISHTGYRYLEMTKNETLLSKGIPDTITLTINDGMNNFRSYNNGPRVLFKKEIDKGARITWVRNFDDYMGYMGGEI